MNGKDYVVQMKVRNGPMLRVMRQAGCHANADLARLSGVSQTEVGLLLNLKVPAFGKNGWRGSVSKIAKALNVIPENLFPPQHFEHALTKNTAEIEMSLEDIARMPHSMLDMIDHETPETAVIDDELREAIAATLGALTPRERSILEQRMGMNENPMTLDECGRANGVTRERVRQIEMRALRKIKHPGSPLSLHMKDKLSVLPN